MSKIQNERENFISNITEIEWIIREQYEKLYVKKTDNPYKV